MRPVLILMSVSLVLASCSDKGSDEENGAEDTVETAGEETDDAGDDAGGTGSGEDGVDSGDDGSSGTDGGADGFETIEDYVAAYCDAILVRCGVYGTTTECVDEIMVNWFAGCRVQSQESAETCIVWLEGLTCEEEGWIDACDQAVTCD